MKNHLFCLPGKLPFCLAGLLLVCAVFFPSCNDEMETYIPLENSQDNLDEIKKTEVSVVDASQVTTLFFSNLTNTNQENKLHLRNHFDPNNVDLENQKKIKKTETFYNEETKRPIMHVVNFEGGGYTIISASRDYYPILAYSETGSIHAADLVTLNEGLAIWAEEVEQVLEQNEIAGETLQEIRYLWSMYEAKDANTELLQTRNNDQYREILELDFQTL